MFKVISEEELMEVKGGTTVQVMSTTYYSDLFYKWILNFFKILLFFKTVKFWSLYA